MLEKHDLPRDSWLRDHICQLSSLVDYKKRKSRVCDSLPVSAYKASYFPRPYNDLRRGLPLFSLLI